MWRGIPGSRKAAGREGMRRRQDRSGCSSEHLGVQPAFHVEKQKEIKKDHSCSVESDHKPHLADHLQTEANVFIFILQGTKVLKKFNNQKYFFNIYSPYSGL